MKFWRKFTIIFDVKLKIAFKHALKINAKALKDKTLMFILYSFGISKLARCQSLYHTIGENLVFSLQHKELMNQTSNCYTWSDIDCCGSCKYQRGQRCWNPASPLYNFKVTLED